jgi:hypothetical protein
LAWPWIIVALCSLILLPDLGADVSHIRPILAYFCSFCPTASRLLIAAADRRLYFHHQHTVQLGLVLPGQ